MYLKKGGFIVPGGNGMGPMGMGPRTGWATGFCAGYGAPGYVSRQGYGYGFGRRGGGFGRGRWFGMNFSAGNYMIPQYSPVPAWYRPNAETEREYLLSGASALKDQLSIIEKRLSELETGK